MAVYGLWYGGSSYSVGYLADDLEVFDSIETAEGRLYWRRSVGATSPDDFDYADGRKEKACTPCVGNDSEMTIWLSDPRESDDPYPDFRLVFTDAETESNDYSVVWEGC